MTGLVHRVAGTPFVYDWVQKLAGSGAVGRRLHRQLGEAEGATVLDIGAGTGLYAASVPPTAMYVAMDNDPRKLEGLARRPHRIQRVVLGDAAHLAFADHSVDYVLCAHLLHHLDDTAFEQCLREMARVVRRRVLVQEPLLTRRLAGRLLWRLDRGSHPRTSDDVAGRLARRFRIESVEHYSILHDYVLIVASPMH